MAVSDIGFFQQVVEGPPVMDAPPTELSFPLPSPILQEAIGQLSQLPAVQTGALPALALPIIASGVTLTPTEISGLQALGAGTIATAPFAQQVAVAAVEGITYSLPGGGTTTDYATAASAWGSTPL